MLNCANGMNSDSNHLKMANSPESRNTNTDRSRSKGRESNDIVANSTTVLTETISKKPFVSPRRVAGSTPNSRRPASPATASSSPNRSGKGNRTSPKRKPISRPCSKDKSLDDDDFGGVLTPKTQGILKNDSIQKEMVLRKRTNFKTRSVSNEDRVASHPLPSAVDERVRSISPDGRSCSSPARDEHTKVYKCNMIEKALKMTPTDVATLRQLAISRGGLLDDDLRKKAWPALLDIDLANIRPKPDAETLKAHRDYNQVLLDVNRSAKRFPPGMEEEIRLSYQDQLIECIMWILVYHEDLHYYQGFHDVVVTFLLVVGEELTFAIMDKLVENHFRDFMDVNMEKTNSMLHYLLPIVGKASPELREFMEKSEVGTFFCLSWLITWYGHALSDFKDIVRLYDFFIACHPLMPIYLAADIVLYREQEVLACECEMPFVHKLLSTIPDDLPFELLICGAGDLFIQYPPNVIEAEAKEQYQLYLDRIEQHRQEALAERARLQANRKRFEGNPTLARRNKSMSLMVKISVWTLVGAVSAIAYTVYKNNALLDWRSWMWT